MAKVRADYSHLWCVKDLWKSVESIPIGRFSEKVLIAMVLVFNFLSLPIIFDFVIWHNFFLLRSQRASTLNSF